MEAEPTPSGQGQPNLKKQSVSKLLIIDKVDNSQGHLLPPGASKRINVCVYVCVCICDWLLTCFLPIVRSRAAIPEKEKKVAD